MVNSIICPQNVTKPSPMDIHDFNSKFKELYKDDFKSIFGVNIIQFVDKNHHVFETSTDDRQRMMIQIKNKKVPRKKKNKKEKQKNIAQSRKAEDVSETDYITAESDQLVEETSDDDSLDERSEEAFLESIKDRQNLTLCVSDSDDNDASLGESPRTKWKEVRKHKNRTSYSGTAKQDQDQEKTQQEIHVQYQRSLSEDERQYLHNNLLQKKESHDFIFKHSARDYMNHPYKLAIDLVSLWNTTARTLSYIVVRLDHSLDLNLLKEYLSLENFTTLPHYQYFEVKHTNTYGIFELPSSRGCGQPAITKSRLKLVETAFVCWEKDQLWYRQSASPTALSLSDPLLAMIYQWFAGDNGSSSTSSKPTPDRKIREENKKSTSITDEARKGSDTPLDMTKSALEIFRSVIKEFLKGKYILLAGNMPKGINNLEAISTVPWMYVFDFDQTSRDSGLLSVNENFIRKRKSLHLTNWRQPPAGITENGTSWTFLCGRRDNPESILQNCNDVRSWFQRVRANIDLHIEQIQKYIEDYTVLTVLMIWPLDEQLAQHMHKFLTRLDDGLDPKPKIVLSIPGKPTTDIGNSILMVLKNEFGENLTIIDCDVKRICSCISAITKNQQIVSNIKYSLPTADEFSDPCIKDSDAAWLREELEILYLTNPYPKCQLDVNSLQEEGDIFFRGGSLRWFAWYEVGAGHFDAQRDLMSAMMRDIRVYIDENRSAVVTLYHAPGSGGSTLAQRILWEFHTEIPCAQAKLRSALPVTSLVERIEMMYAKTHKPVLLLVDGDDEVKVKQLIRTLKLNSRCYIIILYVKRYPYRAKSKTLFLQGSVSIQEAKRLALKFKNQCKEDGKKQAQLSKLCEDVERGKERLVYEFGLATYLHEYKGIEKYVKGYLWPSGKNNTDCLIGRKILCFLSLAYYYGQIALPLQFFCGLIYKATNYLVEMEDLPEPVSQFVVFDKNESKTNNIRVCHYLVAKEILEQVLGNGSEQRSTELSVSARQKLKDICEQFIEYASRKGIKSGNIVYILTRIFIFRDNKDMGENAEQTRKKPVLSRLVLDIHSKGPLYTERLLVLKKLTEAFPNDPNFHAHLGRFYAYCRPNEDDEAEKCLQRATAICEKLIRNKPKGELDDRLLHSLMHVYHIYGTILQKRIARYTGQSPTDEPDINTNDEDFDERLDELIRTAELSCEYFKKCRFYTPDGHESCHGFVSEITVRLQICDFIERHFKEEEESSGIKAYLSSMEEQYCTGRNFVKRSVYSIDNLLMDCLNSLEDEDIDHSVQKVIFWYNHLFSKYAANLEELAEGDDVHAYRLQIAAKKLKYSCGESNLIMLEKISEKEDITMIVQLYENIFRENVSESKSALDRDYKEWIFAIRHRLFDPVYQLESVLLHVRKWHDVLHSPMSKFYLFILTSLLGFGKENTNGSSAFLSEANLLKKDMEKVSKFVLKPKYPREWLRKSGEGIKILESGTRFLGYVAFDDRNLKEDISQTLRICKGTICAPNNRKLSGYISLDLGNNVVPVRVFYIPNKANLASTAHAEKRVEFILGFSLDHGWDAFNVRLLEKYPCPRPGCNAYAEVSSMDNEVLCPGCQNVIPRTEFNQQIA